MSLQGPGNGETREDINSLDWDTTPDKMSLQGLGNGETPGRH